MSAQELISQIKEDYLTCSICFLGFSKPKALPCLHTFCKACLCDYISSRGYESAGCFPCPMCRADTVMPDVGVAGFPDNHLMASLSETVEKSSGRPVPKPRRLLAKPHLNAEYAQVTQSVPSAVAEVADSTGDDLINLCEVSQPSVKPTAEQPSPVSTLSDDFEEATIGNTEDTSTNHSMSQRGGYPDPSATWQTTSAEISETNSWSSNIHMLEPPPPYSPPLGPLAASFPTYSHLNNYLHSTTTWTSSSASDRTQSYVNPSQLDNSGSDNPTDNSENTGTPVVYPTLQTNTKADNDACTENMVLKFGKQGSRARDFLKPFGLAVSREGSFVVSDSSGDQNRIFIFNSKGELTAAFNCGCKAKDLIVTKDNEIMVAVHKNVCAIRHFTMAGMCKAEYGKFFTFEEPSGIGQLTNGGLVLTGTQNHSIYILTDQKKLASKFGRKGNGEGYFHYPGYVTVDSKNQIIVTDKVNNCVQVFTTDGKLRQCFGTTGVKHGQFQSPLGVCVDNSDNIIVADSGNSRVEVFSSKGRWLKSVVTNINELGDKVKPVNVAVTPAGHIAVLLRGPYFAEVRVYASENKNLVQKAGSFDTGASVRYSK